MAVRSDVPQQWSHLPVGYLVFSTSDFAVFLNDQGEVDWETTDEYEASGKLDMPKFNGVHNAAMLLECQPCEDLSKDHRTNFRKMIALAIARGLQNDFVNAEAMIQSAGVYYTRRMRESSRVWYLGGSGVAALGFVLVGAVMWLGRVTVIDWVGQVAFFTLVAGCLGAVGAFFSVIQRTGRLDLDPSAGRRVHRIEGLSRTVAGVITGCIVALAVKLRLVGPSVSEGYEMHLAMAVMGLASGVGERWLPSIISKLVREDRPRGAQESPTA